MSATPNDLDPDKATRHKALSFVQRFDHVIGFGEKREVAVLEQLEVQTGDPVSEMRLYYYMIFFI